MQNKIIIALSAIILGLSGYLFYDSLHSGEMSKAEVQTQFNDLKTDYEFMQKNMETNTGKLKISNRVIEIQQKKIEDLFKRNSISEEQLVEAKKLMAEISKSVLQEFQKRVASLEDEKTGLITNRTIDEKELTELNAKLKAMESANKTVTAQYNTINKKYDVEKKVSVKKDKLLGYASRITLSNFILKGFKVRESGKEVETDKASKVDRIKVDFDINENKIAETGEKELYIVVKGPDGNNMTFADKPSGNFSFDGKGLQYSDKMTIDYVKGEERTLQLVWDSEDFKKGDYKFEVYQNTSEGYQLVGKATKTLE